jgi:CheY-like chemotaxis protein
MRKRVLIVDRGGAAFPLFRAALARVNELEIYGADDGHQAAELVTGLGERDVLLLDITLPFADLVEFLACYAPQEPAHEVPMAVVCSEHNAVVFERELAAGFRAVA